MCFHLRMFLQSLVTAADKNGDRGMDFDEFEGFNDFAFVFQWIRLEHWATWQQLGEALESFSVCEKSGRDTTCFPFQDSNKKLLFRYIPHSP